MATWVDFVIYDADGLPRVSSIDLSNGTVYNTSVPSPTVAASSLWSPGAKMADGRYVFPDSSPSPSLGLFILSADRQSWTQVVTDVAQSTIQVNGFSTIPITSNEVIVFYLAQPGFTTSQSFIVNIDTGASRALMTWANNTDDEIHFMESASLVDGTNLVLGTTEAQYIYLLDPLNMSGASGTVNNVWVNTGDASTLDLDLTASVYHRSRSSVFACGLQAAFPHAAYISEYSYPTGNLLNRWGPFTSPSIDFSANGVVSQEGAYYGIGGSNSIGSFNISTGTLVDYSVSGAFRVIPNSWHSDSGPILSASNRNEDANFYQRFSASSG